MSKISDLLLDKYKPKKYYELLTDEKVNREIQSWLKSWDEIVFPNEKNTKRKEFPIFPSNQNNYYEKYLHDLTYKNYNFIIISGPPGIGKTTLARLISERCGYEVSVINASDERTAEVLLNKIDNATKGHNINSMNYEKGVLMTKPKLLIIDEVDGINVGDEEGNSVAKRILLYIKTGKYGKDNKDNKKGRRKDDYKEISVDNNSQYVNYGSDDDENDENNNNHYHITKSDADDYEDSNKKSNLSLSIRRPIIFICNDLYAKSIKPLRKDGLVINIKKVNPDRLLERLVFICKSENYSITKEEIKVIMEKSEYDIRRCLNILQFISYNKEKGAEVIGSIANNQNSIGFSDFNQGLFEIWRKFLEIDSKFYVENKESESKDKKSVANQIIDEYNSCCEDYQLINNGLYVNYIGTLNSRLFQSTKSLSEQIDYFVMNSKYQNKSSIDETELEMEIESKLNDLCIISDAFSIADTSRSNYILPAYVINTKKQVQPRKNKVNLTYQPNIKIEYPYILNKKKMEFQSNLKIQSYLIENFNKDTSLNISKSTFIHDILPFYYHLIIPNIRELSLDLLTVKEKKQVFVSILILLQIGVKIKLTDNEIELIPNISKLILYESLNKKQVLYEDFNYDEYHRRMFIISNELSKISLLRSIHIGNDILLKTNKDYKFGLCFQFFYGEKNEKNEKSVDGTCVVDEKVGMKKKNFSLFNKRSSNEVENEYLFYIKYNEGSSNSVRRNIRIESLFK